ncbi:MAG: hypothetical protein ACOYXO_01275 [Chloroflexota bacterium]
MANLAAQRSVSRETIHLRGNHHRNHITVRELFDLTFHHVAGKTGCIVGQLSLFDRQGFSPYRQSFILIGDANNQANCQKNKAKGHNKQFWRDSVTISHKLLLNSSIIFGKKHQ